MKKGYKILFWMIFFLSVYKEGADRYYWWCYVFNSTQFVMKIILTDWFYFIYVSCTQSAPVPPWVYKTPKQSYLKSPLVQIHTEKNYF